MMRNEMKNRVDDEIRERLQVPGIIGEKNCQFTTFSQYVLQNGPKINTDVMMVRTSAQALQTRVDWLEK